MIRDICREKEEVIALLDGKEGADGRERVHVRTDRTSEAGVEESENDRVWVPSRLPSFPTCTHSHLIGSP